MLNYATLPTIFISYRTKTNQIFTAKFTVKIINIYFLLVKKYMRNFIQFVQTHF